MKTLTRNLGFTTLSVVFAVIFISLVGVSGYLAYSNNRLKQEVRQVVPAAENQTATTTSNEADTDIASSEKERINTDKEITTTKKDLPKPEFVASNNSWNTFYDKLVDLESEFFASFDFLDWDVTLGEINVGLQRQLVKDSLTASQKIQASVSDAKSQFPNQLACLNKEEEAFEGFDVVLSKTNIYLDLASTLLRLDEIDTEIVSKASTYTLRYQNEQYDEAIILLEQISEQLTDAGAEVREAQSIVNIDGLDVYSDWIDGYSSGIQEVIELLKNKDYDEETSTDFISLGEQRGQAWTKINAGIIEWTVTNVNTNLINAGKAYSQSGDLCSKDE